MRRIRNRHFCGAGPYRRPPAALPRQCLRPAMRLVGEMPQEFLKREQTMNSPTDQRSPGHPTSWRLPLCNGKLRDECLNGEIFYSLKEAQVVIEMWRKLQHDPPAQRPRQSSPGSAQLDHSCLDRRLPSPARSSLWPDCVRRPGSDDELAPLGLDSVLAGLLNLIRRPRKMLKGWPYDHACRELYSLCRTGTKQNIGRVT